MMTGLMGVIERGDIYTIHSQPLMNWFGLVAPVATKKRNVTPLSHKLVINPFDYDLYIYNVRLERGRL
jgi:hypothetical protein